MSNKTGVAFTQEAAQAQAQAAIKSIPPALREFRCPTCGRIFANLENLKYHCSDDHPKSVLPLVVVLHINGKDCEVLIEPHWTLHRALQFRLGLTGIHATGYAVPARHHRWQGGALLHHAGC